MTINRKFNIILAATIAVAILLGLVLGIAIARADAPEHKVTICHATSSDTNPYVRIVVDQHATAGHFDNNGTPLAGHEDDILLQGEQDCPTPPPIDPPPIDPPPACTVDCVPPCTVDCNPVPPVDPPTPPSGGGSHHHSSGSGTVKEEPFVGLQMQLQMPEQAVLADNIPDTLPRTGQGPEALLTLLIIPAGFVLKKLIFR